jgi:hypothetical protein
MMKVVFRGLNRGEETDIKKTEKAKQAVLFVSSQVLNPERQLLRRLSSGFRFQALGSPLSVCLFLLPPTTTTTITTTTKKSSPVHSSPVTANK